MSKSTFTPIARAVRDSVHRGFWNVEVCGEQLFRPISLESKAKFLARAINYLWMGAAASKRLLEAVHELRRSTRMGLALWVTILIALAVKLYCNRLEAML
jgi:hypothetical protein